MAVRSIRLYTQQALTGQTTLALEEGPANHLARVLRARVGDNVVLFNGDGCDWQCTVTDIGKRHVTVHIDGGEHVSRESPLNTHLGLCLSKGERFDWAVQKATELGVARITPLLSERVDVKLPADRLDKKQRHWQQIAISACEQCGRAVVPEVSPAIGLDTWVGWVEADLKLVLHHHQRAGLPSERPASVALLVGPEGGLSDNEVLSAQHAGFQRLCMGPRVMRTETAPVAALAILGARWGDL